MKVASLSALCTSCLYPQEMFLVHISVRRWVDPRAIVRPEGLCQWKIPVTPSGSDPVTFRFLVHCLNHCATTCPHRFVIYIVKVTDCVNYSYCTCFFWSFTVTTTSSTCLSTLVLYVWVLLTSLVPSLTFCTIFLAFNIHKPFKFLIRTNFSHR
jgi:hypothetical protein